MASPAPFQPFRRVQASMDAETRRIMERSAKDIQKRVAALDIKTGIGAQVRAAQLRLVLKQINARLAAAFVGELLPSVQAGRKAAAEAAQTAAELLTAVAYTALPDDVAEALTRGLDATARAGIESDFARVPRELSSLVYKNSALASGKVEDTIRAGLIQGLNAKELAAEVYKYVSPSTPGGASYAAMRLSRTEINNAFHEQQKAGGNRPGVKATKWNLSESHPKPDKCNEYADHPSPLGIGCYAFGTVPDKPHPHCFCFLSYIMMTPVDFASALENGDFDAELERRTQANLARLGVDTTPAPVQAKKPVVYLSGDDALHAVTRGENDFDDDESSAVEEYVGAGYSFINTQMRTGTWGKLPRSSIDDMESARDTILEMMAGSHTTSPVELHRGFGQPEKMFGDAWNDDDVTGLVWKDDAFVSSTSDRNVAQDFAEEMESGGVMIILRVPKGIAALSVNEDESEILLGNGLTYTVVEDLGEDDSGLRQLIVEVSR